MELCYNFQGWIGVIFHQVHCRAWSRYIQCNLQICSIMCHITEGLKPYLLPLMLSPSLGLISKLAMLLFQLWLSFENSLLDWSKALTIYLCSKCWLVFWWYGTKWTSSQVLKLWLPVWMYQVLFCMWLFMFCHEGKFCFFFFTLALFFCTMLFAFMRNNNILSFYLIYFTFYF